MIKKILITGGGGYVGTLLVQELLKKNYKIIVVDTFWFGNYLDKNKNLRILKKNILNLKNSDFKKIDCVIHLASIANDNAADIDQKFAWETSCLGTKIICELAKKNNIKKFIYASSGSVYGIKREKQVTENLSCEPVSVYNMSKMVAERIVLSYKENFQTIIVRPSTLYGYSPRMRLDLTINILCYHAFKFNKVTIFGGKQWRPYLHIKDMINFYLHCLKQKNMKGIYNISQGNLTLDQTAEKIKLFMPKCKIVHTKSNDIRSYRLNSDRAIKSGFAFATNINDEIQNLLKLLKSKKIESRPNNFSINWLKNKININEKR
jgi:nucleoside-diphosphate-sugar epimerase